MAKKLFLLVTALLFSLNALACDKEAGEGFLPKNDMYIPMELSGLVGGISEEDFHAIINKVEKIYGPIIEARGAKLNVVREWQNGQVNAYASRENGLFNVYAIGGLARYETVTPDGFALVMCHEIGHHIAGIPHNGSGWASNEGQSDYFATTKCLRKLWKDENNLEYMYGRYVPTTIKQRCEETFTDLNEISICQRSAMAGLSISNLFRVLRKMDEELSYATPDPTIVEQTFNGHPMPQCRLDTYLSGSYCGVSEDIDFTITDVNTGACTRKDGHTTGVRPLCWYKVPEAPKPRAKNFDRVFLKNECDEDMYALVHFYDIDSEWKTKGWYKVEAGKMAYVANTINRFYFVFASNMSATKVLSGDTVLTYKGNAIPFKQGEIKLEKWGTWTHKLQCD